MSRHGKDVPFLFGSLSSLSTRSKASKGGQSSESNTPIDEKLTRAAAEVHEALAASKVVARQWRENYLTVFLQDATLIRFEFVPDARVVQLSSIHIDRSAASRIAASSSCAALDTPNGLLLIASASTPADPRSAPQLCLVDIPHRFARLGDCTYSRTVLAAPAESLSLNCSGDIAVAHCPKSLVFFRVVRGSGHAGASAASEKGKGSPSRGSASPTVRRQLEVFLQHSLEGITVLHVRFSRHFPNRILLVEQVPSLGVCASKLQLKGNRLTLLQTTTLQDAPADVTAAEWHRDEKAVMLGTQSGLVLLFHTAQLFASTSKPADRASSSSVARRQLSQSLPVTALRWHPSGGIAAAILGGSALCLLTVALHPLALRPPSSPSAPASSPLMDLALCLPPSKPNRTHTQVELMVWEQVPAYEVEPGGTAPSPLAQAVLIVKGGPVALLHLRGACSAAGGAPGPGAAAGGLRARPLAAHLASEGHPLIAVQVVLAVAERAERYSALTLLVHGLLRLAPGAGPQHTSPTTDCEWSEALQTAMGGVLDLIADSEEGEGGGEAVRRSGALSENMVRALRALARSYCQRQLLVGQVHSAFDVALSTHCTRSLEDVYVHAVRHGMARLANVVHEHLQEAAAKSGAMEDCPLSVHQLGVLYAANERLDSTGTAGSSAGPQPRNNSSDMSHDEVAMQGTQLEAAGQLAEALALYYEHPTFVGDMNRLTTLMSSWGS